MLYPNFKLFHSTEDKGFYSSYEAGKELVCLYELLFPEIGEHEEQAPGIGLQDILMYLKVKT